VKANLRQINVKDQVQKWGEKDHALDDMLRKKQISIREALCDNFDTPKAVLELGELLAATNTYMSQETSQIKLPLLKTVARYIFYILKCFGVYDDEDDAFKIQDQTAEGTASYEETIAPLMDALTKFRDAIKDGAKEGPKEIFRLTDELRDDILPNLGIRLEDKQKGQASVWKYEGRETLLKEKQEKLEEKER